MNLNLFRITEGKGFHLPLPNGYTVSIQFGPGNYCDHYSHCSSVFTNADVEECGAEGSSNAETAVINPDGDLVEVPHCSGNTVQAYQTPEEVFQTILWASQQPAPTDQ